MLIFSCGYESVLLVKCSIKPNYVRDFVEWIVNGVSK